MPRDSRPSFSVDAGSNGFSNIETLRAANLSVLQRRVGLRMKATGEKHVDPLGLDPDIDIGTFNAGDIIAGASELSLVVGTAVRALKWSMDGFTNKTSYFLRGAMFCLCFIGLLALFRATAWLRVDESWLVSACIGLLVFNLLPPLSKDSLARLRLSLMIVVGAYIFALKVPRLFTGVLNYELCATVCFVVYSVACILWIRSNRLGNATHNAADQDCDALEDKLK